MRFFKSISLLCALLSIIQLLFTFSAWGDECHINLQASLPLTYNGFVPTAMAKINGEDISFGIDTGTQNTVITPSAAQRLHLPSDPHRKTQVIGTSGKEVVSNALVGELIFGRVPYSHISLPVVSLKVPSTPGTPAPDEHMEGLIGDDILSHYDIELDFPDNLLNLYSVSGCDKVTPPWKGFYSTIPITVTPTRRIALPLLLDGHPAHAIFDTGSSGARLAASSAEQMGLTADILAKDPLSLGGGVAGPSYNVPTHIFKHLQIGPQNYPNVTISVVDFPSPEADLLIGEDYMRPRRFWISYATHTLYAQQPLKH